MALTSKVKKKDMIYIKNKKRRKEEFQFFMHDFIDSCIENGVTLKADIFLLIVGIYGRFCVYYGLRFITSFIV